MPRTIKKIVALGIHERFDIELDFFKDVNIFHGENGVGKTTLLHILANALSGDFSRFNYLKFNNIILTFNNNEIMSIMSKGKEEQRKIEVKLDNKRIYPREKPKQKEIEFFYEEMSNKINIDFSDLPKNVQSDLLDEIFEEKTDSLVLRNKLVSIAYFPAFRTMIEAWASTSGEEKRPRSNLRGRWYENATKNARNWFGNFTPEINFPSLISIEDQLAREIETARMKIWNTDQKLVSEAFQKNLESITSKNQKDLSTQEIIKNINNVLEKLESSPLRIDSKMGFSTIRKRLRKIGSGSKDDITMTGVLSVYLEVLEKSWTVQQESFKNIDKYIDSVNEFLKNKRISYVTDVPRYRRESVYVEFNDKSLIKGLRSLSSGERQIVALIYACTHMSEQDVVLIDEPEISLHVDWQRKLITKMMEQIGKRQIIACTHSPIITADHQERTIDFKYCPIKQLKNN